MAICYLGVGANLGNRRKNIKLALGKINELTHTVILEVASIIDTKPIGGPKDQPKFLNTALKIKTELRPRSI